MGPVSPPRAGRPALSVLTAAGLHTHHMRTLTARPALRWLVPLAVLLAVLASFLVVSSANAKAPLTAISAQDLLVKVGQAKVDGLSGTVVQNADLGIPAIPGGSGSAGGQLTSLLSGSHTMRVWTDGTDKARVAVNDEYAETDVVTNGTDVWTYDSRAKTATHTTLPADAGKADRQAPAGAPQTPQQAAQEVLAKLDADHRRPRRPRRHRRRPGRVRPRADPEGRRLAGQADPHRRGRRRTTSRCASRSSVPVTSPPSTSPTPTSPSASPTPRCSRSTRRTAPRSPRRPCRSARRPTAAEKKDLQARKAEAQKDTTVSAPAGARSS